MSRRRNIPSLKLHKKYGPFDIIFEGTGNSSVVFDAMQGLAKNGVLVLTSVTGGDKKIEVPADKINLDFVLGNKVMVGSVNANREYFESGVRDMSQAEAQYPGWLTKLLTNPVKGLENYSELFKKLTSRTERSRCFAKWRSFKICEGHDLSRALPFLCHLLGSSSISFSGSVKRKPVPSEGTIMIELNKDICSNLDAALRREWLETNGIGGFSSASITGANTRRYHGLLTAATKPPVGRMVLLSKLEETLIMGDRRFDLSTNQYQGTVHPHGFELLASFRLDPFPIFTFEVEGVQIEKSVFMTQNSNTVVIEYRVANAPRKQTLQLEIRPLIAFRDYHSLTHENRALDPTLQQEPGWSASGHTMACHAFTLLTMLPGSKPTVIGIAISSTQWKRSAGWTRLKIFSIRPFSPSRSVRARRQP